MTAPHAYYFPVATAVASTNTRSPSNLQITLSPTLVDASPTAACKNGSTKFLQSTDLNGGNLTPTIEVPTVMWSEQRH